MKPEKLFKKFMKSYGLWGEYKERKTKDTAVPERYVLDTFKWDALGYSRNANFWMSIHNQWISHYRTYKCVVKPMLGYKPKIRGRVANFVITDEIT